MHPLKYLLSVSASIAASVNTSSSTGRLPLRVRSSLIPCCISS
ncbi:hypothetical protein [Leyella stercorea]